VWRSFLARYLYQRGKEEVLSADYYISTLGRNANAQNLALGQTIRLATEVATSGSVVVQCSSLDLHQPGQNGYTRILFIYFNHAEPDEDKENSLASLSVTDIDESAFSINPQ
jgi:hypothetical protein